MSIIQTQMIQDKCSLLNSKIHRDKILGQFKNRKFAHEMAFTSLDLIEDCQNAIDEYKSLSDDKIPSRSTLHIYGVLQALFCQQNGARSLYQSIAGKEKIDIQELFRTFSFDGTSREIRNDIAGHPSDRNYGTEFYFIAKGSNTKYQFTYAGYKPEFFQREVNLHDLINQQEIFILTILNEVEKIIDNINNE